MPAANSCLLRLPFPSKSHSAQIFRSVSLGSFEHDQMRRTTDPGSRCSSGRAELPTASARTFSRPSRPCAPLVVKSTLTPRHPTARLGGVRVLCLSFAFAACSRWRCFLILASNTAAYRVLAAGGTWGRRRVAVDCRERIEGAGLDDVELVDIKEDREERGTTFGISCLRVSIGLAMGTYQTGQWKRVVKPYTYRRCWVLKEVVAEVWTAPRKARALWALLGRSRCLIGAVKQVHAMDQER